ncbi:MAG: LysR substrate-binding domain-containing protein [Halieaceae bacterium]|jgi:LysR family glycine cleavage system transcriptional activator|nr:LysR substrate-binding domain-containing protein [Halieaceae bacterium]
MTNRTGRTRLPSLNALRAFEAAARHLSLKDAAAELCVSQSAVSHQIKTLESQLGVVLFHRQARGVELTSKGKLYYPALRNAFDTLVEATALIRGEDRHGILTLQVYATFAIRWLLPRVARFQQAEPTLQLRLHTDQSDADLEHNDIDAAIRVGRPPAALAAEELFRARMRPVCSPGFLEREGPITRPADLIGKPLLQVYPSQEDWPNWFAGMGMGTEALVDALQLESYEVAINSAVSGMGIMLGQEPYLAKSLAAGTLVEALPDACVDNPNPWFLVARPERWDSGKLRAFRRWLREEISADDTLPSRREDPQKSG